MEGSNPPPTENGTTSQPSQNNGGMDQGSSSSQSSTSTGTGTAAKPASSTRFMTDDQRREWSKQMNERKKALAKAQREQYQQQKVTQAPSPAPSPAPAPAPSLPPPPKAPLEVPKELLNSKGNLDILKLEIEKMESLMAKHLKQYNEDYYLQQVVGAQVDKSVGKRFDELEKKLGLMAELDDDELDEMIRNEFLNKAGKKGSGGKSKDELDELIEKTQDEIKTLQNNMENKSTGNAQKKSLPSSTSRAKKEKRKAKAAPGDSEEESEGPEFSPVKQKSFKNTFIPATKKFAIKSRVLDDIF